MIRLSRVLPATAIALVLSIPVAPAQALGLPFMGKGKDKAEQAPAKVPRTAAKPADAFPIGVWAHEASDLAPDPQVRFGRLSNGMRYALMKNATPSGQASLRLRFDAGSLMETDAQQGLAHFLEHMAFNGSKNVPEGEMTKILERHGLAFGADTNASTAWTETIYKLDLPNTKDETVDVSLMLLRETASNLLINAEAVDRERGVVLSEERTRDAPGYRVFKAREAFLLKDQLAPRRMPIGLAEVIRTAPADQLKDFYVKYYRPERAVLVAAGDFDVDAMEAKIKARFADWQAAGKGGPDPVLGAVAPRGLETSVTVQAGAPLMMELAWLKPADLGPDTKARERKDMIDSLALSVLNRRLERLARSDNPPFVGAGADSSDEFRSAEVTSLSVRAEPDTWKPALVAAEHEQRRLVQYGVRQEELDREVQEWRTRLQSRVAAAATRRTPALANAITGSVDARDVLRSPAQELESFEDVAKGLTAAEVSKAAQALFTGQGPLLFVSTPTPLEGDAAAVQAVFEEARTKPIDAPTVEAVKSWPYASFGPPGEVAEQKDITDLEAVFVRFKNGVRLTVKPTKFRDDQIMVTVRVGHGRQTLSWTGKNTAWLAGSTFTESALKQLSMEDLERIMASRIVGASLSIGDDAFSLSGGTRPEDFDIQLQLLTAYLTEPGYRPEVFARWKGLGASRHDQYQSTPNGVLRRDLPALLRGGDPRWAFPSREDIAASSLDDLKSLLAPLGPTQPIEVVIVGDITVEKAVAGVAATLGAIRTAPPAPAPVKPVSFPAPTPHPLVLTHTGRADQGLGYIAWPTDDFFSDLARSRATRVLGYVMQLRLIDQIRESQGAAYSPSADASASIAFDRFGFLAASVEMPPDKLDAFFRDVEAIAADLRAKPPTADEMERAKGPRIQALLKQRESNEYWLDVLSGAQEDPRRLESVRSAVAGLERVSPAEVQKAAELYLRPDKAWKVKIVPKR